MLISRSKDGRWNFLLYVVALPCLVFVSVFLLAGTSRAEQVALSWNAPTTYTDGTPMTDLTGYKIYYGTSSGNYSNVTDVGNVTSYTVANLATGTYYFAVTAYDSAGVESAYSNEVVLTPSPSPPVSSAITDPVNGAMINTTSYTIRGTATTGASKVEVGITSSGATAWYPAAGTTSWTYSWSPASDGMYTVTSRATDASGNVEVPGAGISVTVDRGKPASSITAPATSSSISRSSANYYIVGTATDSVSGVKKVEVSTDAGTTWLAATGTSSWSYVWALPSTDGSYGIMSRATDNAGNVESPKPAVTLRIDGTAPVSSITSPAAGTNLKANVTVSVAGTASDNGTGVKQVELSFDGGTTWVKASGTTSWSYAWTPTAQGSYNIVSRATDNVGNVETHGAGITVTVDSTAPVSSITAPVAGQSINRSSSQYKITGTATDAASGVKKVEVSTDGGATWSAATGTSTWSYSWTLPQADGIYNIMSRATDNAGNVETPKPAIAVTLDGTKPVSTITSPAAGANLTTGSAVTVSGTASDSGSGVKQVSLSFDGGATWATAIGTSAWSYSWSLPAAGSYTILSKATDNAGNTETPGPGITVTVSNPSPTPSPAASPTSTITYPANHASLNGTSIVISGTATNDGYGIGKVEVSINNGIWRLASGTSLWSYTWTPARDGTFSIRSRATDNAGKVESPITSKIVVKIDRTAPTVYIGSPLNGMSLPGGLASYSIRGNAKESVYGSGLDKVWVSTDDGKTWAEASRTLSFTVSGMMVTRWVYNWTPTADGTYVIKARARDLAGNIRGMRGPTVKVDRTPPVATITAPVNGATRSGSYVYIRGTATDNGGSGLRRVGVSTDGGKTWAAATGRASWYYYWRLPASGSYNIKARARDWSGNIQGTNAGVTVKVIH